MAASTRRTLELLRPIGKALPVFGNTVEGIVEAAIQLIDQAQDAKVLKEEWKKLAEKAANVILAVADTLGETDHTTTGSDTLEHVLVLKEVMFACQTRSRKAAKSSKFQAFLHLNKLKRELEDCHDLLGHALALFNVRAHVYTNTNLSTLDRTVQTGFQDVAKGLSANTVTISEQLVKIEDRIVAQEPDDGQYRYYLYSDFEVIGAKTISGRVVAMRARARGTKEEYTIKYASDKATREMLESLRGNPNPWIEQLVGYTRERHQGGFYVLDSGKYDWCDLYGSLNYRQKTRLAIHTITQLDNIMAALDYVRRRVPQYKLDLCWHESRPWLITYSGEVKAHIAADGRIILPFPFPDSEGPINQFMTKWSFERPDGTQISMARPRPLQNATDSVRWISFRDSMTADYKRMMVKGIIPWGQLPALGLCVINEIPLNSKPMTRSSTAEIVFIQDVSLTSPRYKPLQPPLWTLPEHERHVFPEPTGYYRLSTKQEFKEPGDPSFFLERRASWGHDALHRLTTQGRRIAADHGLSYPTLSAGVAVYERIRICYFHSLEHNADWDLSPPSCLPAVLYFIPYPDVAVGPPYILPGYVSLDPEGKTGSSVDYYSWNDRWMYHEWYIRLRLGEFRFCIERYAHLDCSQLSDGDLAMMKEDHYWGDENDGCGAGLHLDEWGSVRELSFLR